MTIREERERAEAAAQQIAAAIPPGKYHASGLHVVNSDTYEIVAECATHWDACLVMLAAARR